jgi:putative peptidoglycan lipid II flippase
VGGAAIVLAGASLASRFLGLIRDRILATGFGASADLDVYYAAFRIPDFLFQILILGALSAAFIPVFTGYLAKHQKKEADTMASSILNLGVIGLMVAGMVIWVFAPQIMPLVTPGFTDQQLDQTVELTRVMLLSPIFFGMSGVLGGILNSHRKFLAYATAPLFYNLGIIAGALLAPQHGLIWLAYGVVAGAFLQMVIQLIAAVRTGFSYRPIIALHHPGVKKTFLLAVPATVGIAILQINLLLETTIASTLQEGSLSQFMLATSLSMVPVGVIGAPLATAVFPILAREASLKQTEAFTATLLQTIRQILYFIIPASVAMMLLRAQIVRLIYGAGHFDFTDTRYVTSLLGILAVSLFAQALIPLLTRAFYAMRNTRTPVIIAFFGMIVNVGLALTLSQYVGVVGLAIGFSAGSIIQLAMLLFFLSGKVPALEDREMISATAKVMVATAGMAGAMYGTLYGVAYLLEHIQSDFTVAFFAIQTVAASLIGVFVYAFLTKRLGVPESGLLLNLLRRPFGKLVR